MPRWAFVPDPGVGGVCRPLASAHPMYITTPIYYVNDSPHIGHAYTTVVGDALDPLLPPGG